MRISVFGLGYVGSVSAVCLCADGHSVIGVDRAGAKVDLLNEGRSPIIEAGIDALITEARNTDRLRATTDALKAVHSTDMSLVCVGTPSEANGSLNLEHVRNVCRDIGTAMRTKKSYHVVVIRSTVLPGTMRTIAIPMLEASSGKKMGPDFGVCFNPEFLREGTAIHDYYHPPKTVIGESDTRAGDRLLELYGSLEAAVFRTTLEAAEMIKYVDNTWHALKVAFANEIGSVCKVMGIDSFEVMHIFCQDTKLNLSPYYLKPGYAFGGSCLPKDVRALRYRAKTLDVETPVLNSILLSNDAHVTRGVDLILRQGKRKIGILGFSFKAGTDDLRESPIVELIERLIGKGYEVLVYDENVNLAYLTGANRDYILNHIPHLGKLMQARAEDVIAHAEVIVVGTSSAEFADISTRLRPEQTLIDLVRIENARNDHERYEGICW